MMYNVFINNNLNNCSNSGSKTSVSVISRQKQVFVLFNLTVYYFCVVSLMVAPACIT